MNNYKCNSVGIIGAGIQGVCIGLQLIKKGIQKLNKSNAFNHVQALVINNEKVVSFEKRKGTKDMLKK